jgi:hypothetical protein
MKCYSSLTGVFCAIAILVGVAYAQKGVKNRGEQVAATQKEREESVDTLEGTLRVHPKFHHRYYIDGFGDGQECALFQADNRLAKIEQGTRIRVQGDLASRYFGNKSKPSALVSTWIIDMDVDNVEVLRQ